MATEPHPTEALEYAPTLDPVTEQFRALRTEIDLRNRQHTQLVTFKVVSLGGAAAFIVQNRNPWEDIGNDFGFLFIWVVPLVAIIFDMLIGGNLRALYNIGPYIMKYIEPYFRRASMPGAQFWEETVATSTKFYRGYRVGDILAVWSLTFLTVSLAFLVRYAQGPNIYDWLGLAMMVAGSLVSLHSMVGAITKERLF